MRTVLRSQYLDVLKVLKDRNLIKVATGVRRCGKSTLMSQFQDVLRADNEAVSIIDINIDMPDFRFLAEKSWKDVYDFIVEHLKKMSPTTSLLMRSRTLKNSRNYWRVFMFIRILIYTLRAPMHSYYPVN